MRTNHSINRSDLKMWLKIFCLTLFLIPTHCTEQVWVSKERVKREKAKGDELTMEMENDAIYKPVNELILEVTKMQERWNNINEMIRAKTTNLEIEFEAVGNALSMFYELWQKWDMSKRYVNGYRDSSIDSKYVLCGSYYLKQEEKNAIEEFYHYSIKKASKPLYNLNEFVNQTLKDIILQSDIMKNIITIRLKSCTIHESEVCIENIKKWTLIEIKRYRSIMEKVKQKQQIPFIMRMMRMVSDDIRKFKHEYLKILNDKKQLYLCCIQKIALGTESACEIVQEKFVFEPIEFGNEMFSTEIEETTTQMTQATTNIHVHPVDVQEQIQEDIILQE